MSFYPEILPHATQLLLGEIKNLPDLEKFYLSGGTGLALQLGHRESEDLDFFTNKPFDSEVFQQKLLPFGKLEDVVLDEGTVNVFLKNVKLQFLYYPYNLLEDLIPWNGIYLSSILDIACTKLITISSRGGKKDYIDLYFILQKISLPEILSRLQQKYENIDYNLPHILKSLVYFDDADQQPMPRMHKQVTWDEVKAAIAGGVKKITF